MKKKLLIENASQLLTLRGFSHKPKIKLDMSDLGIIENGSLAVEEDRLIAIGTKEEVSTFIHQKWQGMRDVKVINAQGRVVMPGFIDPHTHLIFAGSREQELEKRLQGAGYLDILQAGGGILSTTCLTREASEEELARQARKRLDRFLDQGVTTLEAKSGYGLTLVDEIKQLKVAQKLNDEHPVDIVSTFMGAHAIPLEYKNDPQQYLCMIKEEMIPAVAKEGLAEFCDVFCEKGVFTVEESRQILEAGLQWGLKAKIHADEIESMGGAELAAKVGAISADHLLKASNQGINDMAKIGVIAVLLPGTAFFLMAPYARARDMITAGVPVALSTDRNPGSSPTESIQLMMNLACLNMKMNPAEVIVATTINAAHAIDRAHLIGSLEIGKQADILIMDAPNYLYLQYHFGINLVDKVIKKGQIVVGRD